MTPEQIRLRDYLQTWLRLRKDALGVPKGFHYSCKEDFLLQHGEWFDVTPYPENIPIGAPKSCYSNALVLSVLSGLTYVEGSAMMADLPIAFDHAWNVDKNGKIVDNTWRNAGSAYLGVRFSTGRAENAVWFDNATVLDNPRSRYTLYQRQWVGEDWSHEWPQSSVLQTMRKTVGDGTEV